MVLACSGRSMVTAVWGAWAWVFALWSARPAFLFVRACCGDLVAVCGVRVWWLFLWVRVRACGRVIVFSLCCGEREFF